MGSEAGADRHASSNGKMGLLHDAGGGDEYGDSLAVAIATCVAFVCASLGVRPFSFFCVPRGLARGCVLASVGSEAALVSSCMDPYDIKSAYPRISTHPKDFRT